MRGKSFIIDCHDHERLTHTLNSFIRHQNPLLCLSNGKSLILATTTMLAPTPMSTAFLVLTRLPADTATYQSSRRVSLPQPYYGIVIHADSLLSRIEGPDSSRTSGVNRPDEHVPPPTGRDLPPRGINQATAPAGKSFMLHVQQS